MREFVASGGSTPLEHQLGYARQVEPTDSATVESDAIPVYVHAYPFANRPEG